VPRWSKDRRRTGSLRAAVVPRWSKDRRRTGSLRSAVVPRWSKDRRRTGSLRAAVVPRWSKDRQMTGSLRRRNHDDDLHPRLGGPATGGGRPYSAIRRSLTQHAVTHDGSKGCKYLLKTHVLNGYLYYRNNEYRKKEKQIHEARMN